MNMKPYSSKPPLTFTELANAAAKKAKKKAKPKKK